MTRAIPRLGASLVLLLTAVGSCDAIVGAGDRKLDPSVVCTSSGCACAVGFGDCDGDPDNGCETDLDDPDNCGTCGNVCANGECDDLACACDTGFAECDGDPATVCETDVSSDSAHCGGCTRDCGDAACSDGFCQPEQIASAGYVYNFLLVGSEIYYSPSDSTGVWHVPVDGGTPQQLDVGNTTKYADLLVYDGGSIYWSSTLVDMFDKHDILGTDITTGVTTVLATGETPGLRMAVGGGKVYWGNIDIDTNIVSIHRAPTTAGGAVESVAELLELKFVNDFAVTPDRVFWNDIGTILYSPHDTISESTFQSVAMAPAYFEPTPTSLLYTSVPGGLYELPLDGGSAVKLADEDGYGWLTYDTDHVYFTTFVYGVSTTTTLWRASRAGDEPTLKLHESQGLLPYLPLSLDEQFIYWLDTSTGFIVRIRK